MPKVSIVIPVYNTERYLKECLLSVQRQTLSDFEAIIVDDCSPDNSRMIAENFAQKDGRFRIIKHETNKGLGCARNTGIKIAQGEYINFLDSDDVLPIDAIITMSKIARQENADMVIGNMAWKKDSLLNSVEYIDNRIRQWKMFHQKNIKSLHSSYYASGSITNRIFRTNFLCDNSLLFLEGSLWEDIPFSMKAWFYSRIISYTPEFVYFRTRREDLSNLSISQKYHKQAFLDRDKIIDDVYQFPFSIKNDQTEAIELAKITLSRILGTSQRMLDSADNNIKFWVKKIWFPSHLIRFEKCIHKLSKNLTKK